MTVMTLNEQNDQYGGRTRDLGVLISEDISTTL
jgi:hypothetical protein